ncbi:MAG: DUF4203 domain-containing protein [Actinobacteria bacterium]|nr:DUF4203 domain-containing protein [Actinomycetota bacterium]
MKDVIVGIVAILVGALFCFRGWLAMRLVIPIWGAFAGFVLGAGVIQGWTGDGFLSTTLSWVVGIVVGLVFGVLAYLYYEVSVIVAMAFIGFAIGVGVMSAIGVTWSWVLVIVGIAVGLVLAWFSIISDLPTGLLMALTALGGASAITGGVMLLVNRVNVDDFANGTTTKDLLKDNPWWYVLYIGLVIAGVGAQIVFREKIERSLRDTWTDQGGRHIRSA